MKTLKQAIKGFLILNYLAITAPFVLLICLLVDIGGGDPFKIIDRWLFCVKGENLC